MSAPTVLTDFFGAASLTVRGRFRTKQHDRLNAASAVVNLDQLERSGIRRQLPVNQSLEPEVSEDHVRPGEGFPSQNTKALAPAVPESPPASAAQVFAAADW